MPEPTELPQNVKDAIATLKALSGAEAESVAGELKGAAVYQSVFNSGHSTATKAKTTDITQLTERLTAAEERARKAEEDLQKKQPDLEARDKAWQQKLTEKENELKALQDTVSQAESRTIALQTENALGRVLRPKIAKLVAPTLASQIRRKADGSYELLEEGTGIPVQIPAGKTVFDVAAERASATADPIDKLAGGESGGGVHTGGGVGGGSGYDPVAEGRRMAEQAKARSDNSLAFK